jgi:chromate transporter
VIVIIIIAGMLEKFRDSRVVKGIFEGLRPAVVGFIMAAVLGIYISSLLHVDAWKESGVFTDLFNWKALALFAVLLAFYKWKDKLHPVFIILIAAICGIVFGF